METSAKERAGHLVTWRNGTPNEAKEYIRRLTRDIDTLTAQRDEAIALVRHCAKNHGGVDAHNFLAAIAQEVEG